jgi:hypothetical protein
MGEASPFFTKLLGFYAKGQVNGPNSRDLPKSGIFLAINSKLGGNPGKNWGERKEY